MNVRLTTLVHERLAEVVKPGETVVDATAGNGHDTVFLAKLVGPTGRVFAFDVQVSAIQSTRSKLLEAGPANVTLIHDSHANLAQHVTTPITAVTFNLGYLPGGDHAVITSADFTVAALNAASQLLRPGGIITIVAYPGHPGGEEEVKAVCVWCDALDATRFSVDRSDSARDHQPRLFVIRKREESL